MKAGQVRWAAPARRAPWGAVRRWALMGSLLLNVFLLAPTAAPMLHPAGPHGFDGMVEHFARSLPPADAERLRTAMGNERPGFDAARRDMDRARADLSRAIAADPYDPAVARARMAAWQAQLHGMSDRLGEAMLKVVPLLSPEGRAKLADVADHPPGPPRPDAPNAELRPHP